MTDGVGVLSHRIGLNLIIFHLFLVGVVEGELVTLAGAWIAQDAPVAAGEMTEASTPEAAALVALLGEDAGSESQQSRQDLVVGDCAGCCQLDDRAEPEGCCTTDPSCLPTSITLGLR